MSGVDDPQIVASDPAASAFVEANAGSGKTYTLVTRVARLLLRGVRPEAILCVTYTKAASAEMQTRLFQTLGRWAIAGNDELDRELAKIVEPGRDRSRARALFARALETPGGLKIQTLHAFCEQVLRRFPLEAGLAPGFKVMEDAESASLSRLCREALAEAVLELPEGPLAQAYAHFAVRLAPKDFDAMFDAFAARRRAIGTYGRSVAGGLARDVWRRCGFPETTTPAELETKFIADTRWSEWKRRADEIGLNGTKTAQDLTREVRGLGPHRSLADIRRVFLTGAGEARKFRGAGFSMSTEDWMRSEQSRVIDLDRRLRSATVAEDTVHALTLAIGYIELFEGAKAERSALDFDDLVERVKTLLTETADAAWVLYKLDGGIDHVLLDEAQDTAPAQWDVLRALTEEFFVGKGAGADRRTLFAVGDEKQSIYSFQGAAPERLALETQAFRDAVTTAGLPFEEPKLLESRRSSPEILEFVDAVFADSEVARGLRTARGDNVRPFPLKHLALRVEDGCVDLWPREAGGDPEEVDPWVPVDAEPGESANKRLAGRIAFAIREMVDRGEAVIDKASGEPRPMRYVDVLILVRRRNVLFDEIIRALKRLGVPIAGRDRLKLAEHGAFEDLRALGRFACFPNDDLILAGLLRSPFCDVSEQGLFDLAFDRERSLWVELSRRAGERLEWRAARDFLGWVREEAGTAAPFDLYGRVLGRLDTDGRSMRQRLLTRLGQEAEEAIDAFLGCALDAEARGERDLETFVAGLDSSELEIKREAEGAAETGLGEVRVMTAHGAKGLEAPVVILPDTCTKAKARPGALLACDDGGFLWCGAAKDDGEASKAARDRLDADGDHESLRLLYVALTRARDRLIVCGVKGKREQGFDGSWYEVIERAAARLDMHAILLPGGGEALRYGDDPYVLGRASETTLDVVALPPWARGLVPVEAPLARYASPSTVLEEAAGVALSPLATARGLGRFRRGEIIHRLLQLLPEVAADRRLDAARRLLAREPELDEAQRSEMARAALGVLEDERFAAVFGPGSRAEVAVAGSAAGLPDGFAVSGRLDRLVIEPGRVLVVDFKTNRPAPGRIEDADRAYILQMALYRAVLAEAFPGRTVEAALLWTDGPKLMSVPPALMDAEIERLAAAGRTPTSGTLAEGVF